MSAEYEYIPNIGYGPFKFGMSPEDIHAILGPPTQTSAITDFLDPQYIDDEDLPFITGNFSEDYEGGLKNNAIPGFWYDPAGVAMISLQNRKGHYDFDGIDLFDRDRQSVMELLARKEETVYYNGESYFFRNSALVITAPELWKRQGTVNFVRTDYIMHRLAFDDWEMMDELEFF